MKVLLLDTDLDYSQRFQYYFTKKYTNIQVSICDHMEAAKKMLQEDFFDIVLFDAAFDDTPEEDLNMIQSRSAFAFISGTRETVAQQETLFKYCGISEIFTMICAIYEKKRNRVVKARESEDVGEKGTEVILFLPIHGGAGSSTMAAACAVALSDEHNVLYLNLEQRPSDAAFFSGDKDRSITDIVTLLQTRFQTKGLVQMLENVIQRDQKQQAGKVSYIKGYTNIMDCVSMTEQSLKTMLNVIKTEMDFRYIIVDADFIMSRFLDTLIYNSDKAVFTSSGADISIEKLRGIQRYLEVLARNTDERIPEKFLLLNQYYGMNEELAVARDMEIIAKFARYKIKEQGRISTQNVIDQVLSKKEAFDRLR